MRIPEAWKHPRLLNLGTRLVLFFVALLVLVQGVGAFLVIRANAQIARQTIDQELGQGERVFRQLLAQRQARLEQAASILSADFAFRQAMLLHGVDHWGMGAMLSSAHTAEDVDRTVEAVAGSLEMLQAEGLL